MAKRQKLSQVEKFKFVYNIERSDTPGVTLDPTTMLSGVDCTKFFIVRQNSQRYTEHVQVKILNFNISNQCSIESEAFPVLFGLNFLTKQTLQKFEIS